MKQISEETKQKIALGFKNFLEKFNIKINDKNLQLYLEAFTHNSYSNEKQLPYSYQRLECLGDAILQKETTLFLFQKYPHKNEGELTNFRSIIVRKETLAHISSKLNLGKLILLGHGEVKTRGYQKDNILADIFESFLAAVYLDKGDSFASDFILKYVIKYVYENDLLNTVIDYKTELQEVLQSSNRSNPQYLVVDEKWSEEDSVTNRKILYNVEVIIGNISYGKGFGYSIKEAEQEAAKSALEKLPSFHKNKKIK